LFDFLDLDKKGVYVSRFFLEKFLRGCTLFSLLNPLFIGLHLYMGGLRGGGPKEYRTWYGELKLNI
jgi:hypothetical protein